MKKLAVYRNTLTHLGYASIFDWYKILVTLEGTLKIIEKFYFKNISYKNENNEDLIIRCKKVLERSEKNTKELWMASKEEFLMSYEEYLEVLLSKLNVSISDESQLIYNNQLYKTLKLVENDKKYIIHFKYSYINESIFLLNKDNEIIFVICIDDFNINFDEKGEMLNIKEQF